MNNILRNSILISIALTGLQSCSPDFSPHIEVLDNIDKRTQYFLYENIEDLDKEKPLKSGALGQKFIACLTNYDNEWNPGGTENKLYLEIQANNGLTYYYTMSTAGNEINYISRWNERTDFGYKGGKPLLKVKCLLSDLGVEVREKEAGTN